MLCQFRKDKAARCRNSSPFTSFSPTLGKLATKFEMLCKKTDSQQFQSFGGETSGAGGAGDEGRWVRAVSVEGAGGAAGAA